MRDVKTKPKSTKRKQYKPKQAARTTVPLSTVDTLKRQYAQKNAEFQKQTSEQYEKPENYAVDEVEDRVETAVYTAADVIARTGKNIKNTRQRRIKQDIPPMPDIMQGTDAPITQYPRMNQPKTAALPEAKPKPQERAKMKMRQEAAVKAKEQRTAAQSETKSAIKTKEEYLNINQSPPVKENPKAIKTKEIVSHSGDKSAAELPKIKTRQTVTSEKAVTPTVDIKTKESVLSRKSENTTVEPPKIKTRQTVMKSDMPETPVAPVADTKTKESVLARKVETTTVEPVKIKTRQAVTEQKPITPKSEVTTKESIIEPKPIQQLGKAETVVTPKADIKTRESVLARKTETTVEPVKIKTRQAVTEQKPIAPTSEIKTKENIIAHSDNVKVEPTKPIPKSAPVRETASTVESLPKSDVPKSAEPPMKIKTKDEYLKHKTEKPIQQVKQDVPYKGKPPFQPKTLQAVRAKEAEQELQPVDNSQIARRRYVQNKLKAQSEAAKNAVPQSETQTILVSDASYSTETAIVSDVPIVSDSKTIPKQKPAPEELIKTKKIDIKTRESYINAHNRVDIKAKSTEVDKARIVTTDKRVIKRIDTSKSAKTKAARMKAAAKKSRTVKTANRTIKKTAGIKIKNTQKQVTKQAVKKAAMRAKQLAQQAAQSAKTAVRYTVRFVKAAAQAAASAAKAVISALAAMGGWAVLLVVLIIVIIIAAIAASPFGIFISEEVNDVGTIPLSQIIAEYNVELTQEVEDIELSIDHVSVDVVDNQTDTNVVIAIFAAKTAGAEDDTATDVVVFDADKAEKLKEYFRAANTVEYSVETYYAGEDEVDTYLTITVSGKTKEELMDYFEFTDKQREAVETLLEHGDVLTSTSHSLAVTDANVQAIVEGLPASLSQKRKDVVKNAASLVGKVNYFWGGKSSAIGWDSAWGTMQRVTAEGSPSSGTIRSYGLDCSGFVTWAFNNSGMGYAVGHGTFGQRDASILISASIAEAGDLCFLPSYSHVGIVVGKDRDGNILVIHCSSSANNVVLSTAASVGFTVFRRPMCY